MLSTSKAVGADREVARVCLRLRQEPRAGDGVVDLRLGSPAGPVLQEGGREQRIQLRAEVEERIGLDRGVITGKIHVAQGICNLLIHFGPRVEVEQRGDDLGIDLAAVVVARQSRADGRGHRAAGGVVTELAGHEARHIPLVPVRHQGRGDEGLDLRLVLELGQVQGVDGSGDRCALSDSMRMVSSRFWKVAVSAPATDRLRSTLLPRSRLKVGPPFQVWPLLSVTDASAAAMAASRSAAVPSPVGHQRRRDRGVRLSGLRRPAGPPSLGHQRVGDGLVHLDRGAVGHQPRREGGVRLGAGVVGPESCRNCGVPLGRRPVGHQGIGDGLVHLDRGAVIGQLGVRVALDGRHHGDTYLCSSKSSRGARR